MSPEAQQLDKSVRALETASPFQQLGLVPGVLRALLAWVLSVEARLKERDHA